MRLFSAALCTTVAVSLLAGCSGNTSSPSSSVPSTVGANAQADGAGFHGIAVNAIPKRFLPVELMPMRGRRATAAEMKGIYVSTFDGPDLYGFPKNNSGNGPSTCSVSPTESVNNFGVDNAGNLMVPNKVTNSSIITGQINVYGPGMCGPLLGTITDPYGQASDASAVSATTGNIAVGNILGTGGNPGNIAVCTLTSGTCSTDLTNPNIYEVGGVAMARNGDCWADSTTSANVAVLVYFAGCSGAGVVTTGFTNPYYGGIDIDKKGNLVTTSLFGRSTLLPSEVDVYSGCNPACTLISTSTLTGESVFGHLGKLSLRFVTTDVESKDIEVYKYQPSGLTLYYSFTGGLPCASTDECESAAYSPSSQK
jgi:hypothetical protein